MEENSPVREPARERFANAEHLIDLDEASRLLNEEDAQKTNGHRQIALHKTSHTTIAHFIFDSGGGLPRHRAHGAVVIHALEGCLRITTPETNYTLSAGQLLVLAPDVPHDVIAEVASRMLLTVSLIPPKV